MVNDTEARNAVRQLMQRFELIAAQVSGVAYVLAKRDPQDYARLLESAELATTVVIRPSMDARGENSQVYSALDDPNADWPKAVFAMLNEGAIEFTGNEAIERFKLMRELDEKFDAESKKRKKTIDGRSGD
jgi:hypothetical protein